MSMVTDRVESFWQNKKYVTKASKFLSNFLSYYGKVTEYEPSVVIFLKRSTDGGLIKKLSCKFTTQSCRTNENKQTFIKYSVKNSWPTYLRNEVNSSCLYVNRNSSNGVVVWVVNLPFSIALWVQIPHGKIFFVMHKLLFWVQVSVSYMFLKSLATQDIHICNVGVV